MWTCLRFTVIKQHLLCAYNSSMSLLLVHLQWLHTDPVNRRALGRLPFQHKFLAAGTLLHTQQHLSNSKLHQPLPSQQLGHQMNTSAKQERVVLYRGAYMRPFRMLVRFKIFQLVGIASLAIPINTFLVEVQHHLSLLRDKLLMRTLVHMEGCASAGKVDVTNST